MENKKLELENRLNTISQAFFRTMINAPLTAQPDTVKEEITQLVEMGGGEDAVFGSDVKESINASTAQFQELKNPVEISDHLSGNQVLHTSVGYAGGFATPEVADMMLPAHQYGKALYAMFNWDLFGDRKYSVLRFDGKRPLNWMDMAMELIDIGTNEANLTTKFGVESPYYEDVKTRLKITLKREGSWESCVKQLAKNPDDDIYLREVLAEKKAKKILGEKGISDLMGAFAVGAVKRKIAETYLIINSQNFPRLARKEDMSADDKLLAGLFMVYCSPTIAALQELDSELFKYNSGNVVDLSATGTRIVIIPRKPS